MGCGHPALCHIRDKANWQHNGKNTRTKEPRSYGKTVFQLQRQRRTGCERRSLEAKAGTKCMRVLSCRGHSSRLTSRYRQSFGRGSSCSARGTQRCTPLALQPTHGSLRSPLVYRSPHAGLECGAFYLYKPELDMIAIGPTIRNPHTVKETLETDTIARVWRLLEELLGNI